jgi:hypothetical protein
VGTYQRFLTAGSAPFDPLELAKETEKIITRRGPEGLERKYTGIYSWKREVCLHGKQKKT